MVHVKVMTFWDHYTTPSYDILNGIPPGTLRLPAFVTQWVRGCTGIRWIVHKLGELISIVSIYMTFAGYFEDISTSKLECTFLKPI